MVMSVANEREFGTLSAILASPANRLALFFGRAIPVIGHGLLVSAFGFGVGFVLLDLRLPLSAVPAVALTVVLAAASATMFGMVVASVGLRVRDLWVGSNLAYYLMLLLCGTVVPLSAMPGWLATIGRAMPLTHGIQAARELAAGASLSDVSGLLGTEALIGLAYGAVGYGLLRFFEAESRRRATLDLL
jgi:ABC-2 type transport system permease protein